MNEEIQDYINELIARSIDGLKAVLANGINDQSQDTKLLAQALTKCQGQLDGALKDKSNPFFKSKYADLESVWGVARKPLSDNKLAITQTPDKEGNHLITVLMHESGQWTKGYWPILVAKKDSQGFMASVTYARRGALSAMVGIYQADDDGNTSSGNATTDYTSNGGKKQTSKIGTVKTPQAKTTSESDKVVKMAREVMDEGIEKLSTGKISSLNNRLAKLPQEKQDQFYMDMSIEKIEDLRKDEFINASKTLSKLEKAS